jgi:uncharacterized protein
MHESLPSTIDYIEMPSRDLEATKKFFAALFGWTFEDYGPEYAAFDDGRMAGGFFAAEDNWMSTAACPLVVFYSAELEMAGREGDPRHFQVPRRPALPFPGPRQR